MENHNFNSASQNEIFLEHVLGFIKKSWRFVVIGGVLGLVAAYGFIKFTPIEYEAFAQVDLAKIGNTTNPGGTIIEEPSRIIARIKSPSNYGEDEIVSCDVKNKKSSSKALTDKLKIYQVKGTNSIIEFKVRASSKIVAINCGDVIFEKIKNLQNQIIAPYIDDAKILLAGHKVNLEKLKILMSQASKSNDNSSLFYFSYRDELISLNSEIRRLEYVVYPGNIQHAKMLSPIYISDDPVYPNKKIILMAGLLIGLAAGFLSALFYRR